MTIRARFTALWDTLNRNPGVVFPLCFVFPSTLNLLFFYLGFGFEDNIIRSAGFILGNLLFAVLCGLLLLVLLRERAFSRRVLLLSGAVLLFYGICYGASFYRFGLHQNVMLNNLEQFIMLSVPAFFAGLCAAAGHGEKSFFSILESASFLAFPGALIYMNSVVFNCLPWNYNANLGIMNYMSIAYTFLPYFLAHAVRFAQGAAWPLPFGRAVRRPQLIRGVFLSVYWIALIGTATRGALLTAVFFLVLLSVSELIHREDGRKRTCLLAAVMTGVLVFNLFIFAPPGLYRISRMNIFLSALKEGELLTTGEQDSAASRIDDLVRADGGHQITNLPGTTEPGPDTAEPGPDTAEPGPDTAEPGPDEPPDISSEGLQVGNRGTLFKLSIKEFLKSPLTGMGPGGFSVKYGMYPHSAVLELLCETGLAGSAVLLCLILFAYVRLLAGRENRQIRYILIFLTAYALQANISATVWRCTALMAALGYGLSCNISDKKGEPITGEGDQD